MNISFRASRIFCWPFSLLIVFFLFKRGDCLVSSVPDKNLRCPVLVTLSDGTFGSGFYLLNKKDKIVYFVTARHVFFKKDEDILLSNKATLLSYSSQSEVFIPIELELQLYVLYNNNNIKLHRSADVVIVKVATGEMPIFKFIDGVSKKSPNAVNMLMVEIDSTKKYQDVVVSNAVFVFGYPASIGIRGHPQIEADKPLLRSGIIAGKNDINKTIILDCPVYFGNSGSPVVEVDEVTLGHRKHYIIGIVSELIPFEEEKYKGRHEYSKSEIENSGYSVVIPIDAILDVMN